MSLQIFYFFGVDIAIANLTGGKKNDRKNIKCFKTVLQVLFLLRENLKSADGLRIPFFKKRFTSILEFISGILRDFIPWQFKRKFIQNYALNFYHISTIVDFMYLQLRYKFLI